MAIGFGLQAVSGPLFGWVLQVGVLSAFWQSTWVVLLSLLALSVIVAGIKQWQGAHEEPGRRQGPGNFFVRYVVRYSMFIWTLLNIDGGGRYELLAEQRIAEFRYSTTPLYTAAKEGHGTIVHQLLDAGANVDRKTHDGWTPLHVAAKNGHVAIVDQLLVARNKCLSSLVGTRAVTLDGRTPLHLAAENGHVAIVGRLLGAGAAVAAVTFDGRTPLHLAAENGHVAIVDRLLGAISSDTRFVSNAVAAVARDGRTPLHLAAENGHVAIVGRLLGAMAPNARLLSHSVAAVVTNNGRTPLHLAAENGHVAIVNQLLVAGAAVDAVDLHRQTPLGLAIRNDGVNLGYNGRRLNLRAIEFLMSRGAAMTDTMVGQLTGGYQPGILQLERGAQTPIGQFGEMIAQGPFGFFRQKNKCWKLFCCQVGRFVDEGRLSHIFKGYSAYKQNTTPKDGCFNRLFDLPYEIWGEIVSFLQVQPIVLVIPTDRWMPIEPDAVIPRPFPISIPVALQHIDEHSERAVSTRLATRLATRLQALYRGRVARADYRKKPAAVQLIRRVGQGSIACRAAAVDNSVPGSSTECVDLTFSGLIGR